MISFRITIIVKRIRKVVVLCIYFSNELLDSYPIISKCILPL